MSSIAAIVVPAIRLRRDTTGWSYLVPRGMQVVAGQLVQIRFKNTVVNGVVWEVIEKDSQATQPILEVLTPHPLVRPPARRMIELMAERGLCSLSTALYVWLPASLRDTRLSPYLRSALSSRPEPSQGAQRGICIGGQRPRQERMLNGHVAHLFADSSEREYFQEWLKVDNGIEITGLGREGVLFAPWRNLRELTLVEPEDISFYRESTPYIPLSELLEPLASGFKMQPVIRSFLPTKPATLLWGKGATGNDRMPPRLWHIDTTGQPPLPLELLERLKQAIHENQPVLILLNAHDRYIDADDGRKTKKIGIESLPKLLAEALGLEQLPTSIHIGTRALFQNPLPPSSLGIVFSLAQWLQDAPIGDRLHGWSDLGRLLATCDELLLLSRSPANPLPQSLLQRNWAEYLTERLERLKQVGLPPFCEQIAISVRGSNHPDAEGICDSITPLLREPWSISRPFDGQWRKARYTHILLTAPTGTRLPTAARAYLVALERPWKIQRSPWHIL